MDLVGQICDSIEREKFRFLCRFNLMFVRAVESYVHYLDYQRRM
jgi:hypothetical protein